MADNRTKRVNPLKGLSALLEDELLKASGKELEDIAREWGVDPAASPEAVDSAFKKALRMHSQARLREAKRVGEQEISRLSSSAGDLPRDRELLIAMLADKLRAMGQKDPGGVTMQHRDLEELNEDGLRSLLKHLSALDNA
ncbi:MAG: hypothetical protein C5B46_08710 [Proteobacteria bacterium]|nr:MAG: hypothetical protein C5B46_08710 [Pseudomonadota bacterium]